MSKKNYKPASKATTAIADWDEALGPDISVKAKVTIPTDPESPIVVEKYEGSSPIEISEYLKEVIEEELKTPQLTEQHRQIICSGLRRVLNSISPEKPDDRVAAEEITPFSLTEAQAYGKRQQEYGKFSGKPMSSIPREYLGWLADNKRKEVTEWKSLLRYLKYLDSKTAEE